MLNSTISIILNSQGIVDHSKNELSYKMFYFETPLIVGYIFMKHIFLIYI